MNRRQNESTLPSAASVVACLIVDASAAYGRWECELRIVTVSGETIDVAAWIRANKYERRVAK